MTLGDLLDERARDARGGEIEAIGNAPASSNGIASGMAKISASYAGLRWRGHRGRLRGPLILTPTEA